MPYVISVKGFGITYYLSDGGDSKHFTLVLNPLHALSFNEREKAKDFISQNIKNGSNVIIENADNAYEKYSNALEDGFVVGHYPRINIDNSRVYNPDVHDKFDVIKFWAKYGLYPDTISRDVVETWPKIYQVCQNVKKALFYEVFDENENNCKTVVSFDLSFDMDHDFDVFEKEFLETLKYANKYDGEYKVYTVTMDNCENPVIVELHYKNDLDCMVIDKSGAFTVVLHKGALKNCFEFFKNGDIYDIMIN